MSSRKKLRRLAFEWRTFINSDAHDVPPGSPSIVNSYLAIFFICFFIYLLFFYCFFLLIFHFFLQFKERLNVHFQYKVKVFFSFLIVLKRTNFDVNSLNTRWRGRRTKDVLNFQTFSQGGGGGTPLDPLREWRLQSP